VVSVGRPSYRPPGAWDECAASTLSRRPGRLRERGSCQSPGPALAALPQADATPLLGGVVLPDITVFGLKLDIEFETRMVVAMPSRICMGVNFPA
jgi:hypothetical protein